MNAQSHRRTMIAIALFLTFLVIVYIYVFDPGEYDSYLPVGISDFRDRSSYQIDPVTILDSLDRAETDVFSPVDSDSQTPLDGTVSWQQADFITVARALNQFVWKEPLSGWRLYSMHFSTPCKDNLSGFAEADFYYFKTAFRENGKIRYTTQNFFILPEYGEVNWAGGANFPHPLIGWENIRLSTVQISAEHALAIAEENGGKETRQLVENKCTIHVRLAGDSAWQILIYQNDTSSSLFRMVIDSESGKIE
ncbi:MAG: hypothetical protein L0287_07410 [Anaerolineae bacterium]|nr:hypothetical protein [Anaerolineae bacterium]MCI0609368.1 hypothetical protein [Anaerolineae bacterium]